jgi:hypothetical protein
LVAFLAVLTATARALTRTDRRSRVNLIGAGAVLGLIGLAGGIGLSGGAASLAALGTAGLVAIVDIAELGLGAAAFLIARPAKGDLRRASEAIAAGDRAAAAAAYRQAIPRLVRGGRREKELIARQGLIGALLATGEWEASQAALDDLAARANALDDPELAWSALLLRAAARVEGDRLDRAVVHLTDAATLARDRLTGYHIGVVFSELAWIEYQRGDRELAAICLTWAAYAAGQIDTKNVFTARCLLLAGLLAAAQGDLTAAEAPLRDARAIASLLSDHELLALWAVESACLAYLQTWYDTARQSLESAAPDLAGVLRRSVFARLLLGLGVVAWIRERDSDGRAFARLAEPLAEASPSLAALARYCQDPTPDPDLARRADSLAALLSPREAQPAVRDEQGRQLV